MDYIWLIAIKLLNWRWGLQFKDEEMKVYAYGPIRLSRHKLHA